MVIFYTIIICLPIFSVFHLIYIPPDGLVLSPFVPRCTEPRDKRVACIAAVDDASIEYSCSFSIPICTYNMGTYHTIVPYMIKRNIIIIYGTKLIEYSIVLQFFGPNINKINKYVFGLLALQ